MMNTLPEILQNDIAALYFFINTQAINPTDSQINEFWDKHCQFSMIYKVMKWEILGEEVTVVIQPKTLLPKVIKIEIEQDA